MLVFGLWSWVLGLCFQVMSGFKGWQPKPKTKGLKPQIQNQRQQPPPK